MKSIGEIIKKERIKQNIKQVALAKGICSTSYLSKIENQKIIPNDEIVELLIEKLKLELLDVSHTEEDSLIFTLSSLYKESLLNRNKNEILKSLNNIDESINFKDVNKYYYFQLYLFRIKLATFDDINNLHEDFLILQMLEGKLELQQEFILNVNMSLYYYYNNQNHKALPLLEQTLRFYKTIPIEEWEIADFNNIISTFYLKSRNNVNSIKYANEAVEYYNSQLFFERSIDCYIKIGIAYKNLLDYNQAQEIFSLAQRISVKLKLSNKEGIIYHNLGSLYAVQENHKKALEYYLHSFELRKIDRDIEGVLLTILSIVKEYSKQHNSSQLRIWSKEGLSIIQRKNLSDNLSYYYHFSIYLSKETENFEDILIKAIKHFEKILDLRHVQKYSILLADYYVSQNKFKASGIYYKKAIEVLLKERNYKSWEDI